MPPNVSRTWDLWLWRPRQTAAWTLAMPTGKKLQYFSSDHDLPRFDAKYRTPGHCWCLERGRTETKFSK